MLFRSLLFFAEIGHQTLTKNRADGLNGVTFVSFLSQLFYLTSEMGAKMTKVMSKTTPNKRDWAVK